MFSRTDFTLNPGLQVKDKSTSKSIADDSFCSQCACFPAIFHLTPEKFPWVFYDIVERKIRNVSSISGNPRPFLIMTLWKNSYHRHGYYRGKFRYVSRLMMSSYRRIEDLTEPQKLPATLGWTWLALDHKWVLCPRLRLIKRYIME